MNIGINGLGRIGRCVLRNLWLRGGHPCVHVNELNPDVKNIAYLLKYDSVYGHFPADVKAHSDRIVIGDGEREWIVKTGCAAGMGDVDWPGHGVNCIVDATGVEANARAARICVRGGVSHVIVSNHFADADHILVFGLNEDGFNAGKHRVVATSICDAIAISPIIGMLDREFGIRHLFLSTLHPWLSYQKLTDGYIVSQQFPASYYNYYPLGRSSVGAMIPKSTSVGGVLRSLVPQLEKRITSYSYRTPTQAVCSADLSMVLERNVTEGEIHDAVASLCRIKNLSGRDMVRINDEQLVSTDFVGEFASSVVDRRWTAVTDGIFVKMVLWYDNEWGYSNRVVDAVALIAATFNRDAFAPLLP